jgi:lysophospholipase L1-like esterase
MARSKLTAASIALNAALLVALSVLWSGRGTAVTDFLDKRMERTLSFFETYPVAPEDVVFLGDSITETGLWPEIFPDLPVRNRGRGGDTVALLAERLDQVVSGRPRAIFLNIGTNDLTHGPVDREVSYRQYREIIDHIRQASPSTAIHVQSLLPRGVKFRGEIEAFNVELQKMARKTGVNYVDLYPHFLAEDGSIRDDLSNDELHLLGEGYALWAQLLAPHIDSYR